MISHLRVRLLALRSADAAGVVSQISSPVVLFNTDDTLDYSTFQPVFLVLADARRLTTVRIASHAPLSDDDFTMSPGATEREISTVSPSSRLDLDVTG
jgi:hypothetical protein